MNGFTPQHRTELGPARSLHAPTPTTPPDEAESPSTRRGAVGALADRWPWGRIWRERGLELTVMAVLCALTAGICVSWMAGDGPDQSPRRATATSASTTDLPEPSDREPTQVAGPPLVPTTTPRPAPSPAPSAPAPAPAPAPPPPRDPGGTTAHEVVVTGPNVPVASPTGSAPTAPTRRGHRILRGSISGPGTVARASFDHARARGGDSCDWDAAHVTWSGATVTVTVSATPSCVYGYVDLYLTNGAVWAGQVVTLR